MNAIRRDEDSLDNIHSIYVDQWDWEKIITRETRNIEYLKLIVTSIVNAICDTNDRLLVRFPQLTTKLCREVSFVTTQELEDMYPDMTDKQRENAITKEKRTVFIMQIGDKLKGGKPHDKRAPDYDDWALNGDLLMWSDVLNCAIELSSMGIRVDEKSLKEQLCKAGCEDRMKFEYHKMIADGALPLTIGGGVGQSRLCMLMLEKAHVGEVQASIWPEDMEKECKQNNIVLL